ncbi:MAG: hypothetical protein KC910_05145 [Candidatus Eremiobacteraeota bacterium]|nr:hypothetical protein [Candidatus Eremiobacteraeota bacterium]
MADLERHLDALRSEGSSVEEGVFTLNQERATDLMRRLKLADPHAYLLKMVQAAVRGQATWIRVTQEGQGLRFEHDGPGDEAADRHFQVAVGAFTNLTEEAPSQVASPSARAWFFPRPTKLFGLVGRRPELDLLKNRCVYCPIPLWLDGKLVNRPLFGQRQSYEKMGTRVEFGKPPRATPITFVTAPALGPALLPAPAEYPNERRFHFTSLLNEEESDQPAAEWPGLSMNGKPMVACHAMLHRAWESWSELTWVLDGVALTSERNVLDRPGLQAVVSASDLEVDLSEFGVVHNDAFYRLTNQLRQRVLWMY